MKFRVETLGPGWGLWLTELETPFGTDAADAFHRKVRVNTGAVTIRLSARQWPGRWHVLEQETGTFMAEFEKETKPMSTGGWTKHDCGCADYRCQWHTTQAWAKKEEPMSTKQRGDVERHEPTDQRNYSVCVKGEGEFCRTGEDSYVWFTRDEFRRIWEAGNAEFGAGLHHVGPCEQYAKQVAELQHEVARLREWHSELMRKADAALRGEKAP